VEEFEETKKESIARTKRFAVNVIGVVRDLPHEVASDVIGRQLVRSATSVAANYRAVCRAKSRADALPNFGTVEEEADESSIWLELLADTGFEDDRVASLMAKANELPALSVASILTMRKGLSGEPRTS
jgi:four helix bundle protein